MILCYDVYMFTDKQREIRLIRAKEWNNNNKDRCKQNAKLYYLKNKDYISSKHKKYVNSHKDKFQNVRNEWVRKYPWYDSWQACRQRCNNVKNPRYSGYGGKGIKCLLTKMDMIFMWTRDNADKMDKPSVDRINNNGDYTLDNCRFIEMWANSKKRIMDNAVGTIYK